ncbi:small ubiquitin-related modifier 1-like protein, partial [Tanacetum coccineum]
QTWNTVALGNMEVYSTSLIYYPRITVMLCDGTRNDHVAGLFYECLAWTVIDMDVVITDNGLEGVRFMKWVDCNEVFFRMKRSTQLKELMNVYCDLQSVELDSIVFLYFGSHLGGDRTPDEVRSLPFSYPQVEVA